jgi:PKD repeat protein
VKEKKEDKHLRDLFRHKLDNIEITPGASVKTGLMRKLGRKEFLRFIPGRFNIYYLGGIVAATVAATAILIFSGSEDDKKGERSHVPSFDLIMDDSTDTRYVYEEKQIFQDSGMSKATTDISAESAVYDPGERSPGNINIQSKQKNTIREKDYLNISDITGSISKSNLLIDSGADRHNLKSKLLKKEPLFEPSVTSGCTPLKVRFISNSASSCSFHWSFGDGGYSNEKDPEWIFDIDGEYKVTLNVLNSDGSKEISSAVITAYPKPVARFEMLPENADIPDDEIQFINYSTNVVKSKWEFGDGTASDLFEPRHKYEKSGNYTIRLIVYSECGCADSIVLVNAFEGSGNFIDFPNAFIPNPGGPTGGYYSFTSDVAARIFHPVFSGVSDYQLRIFSKHGILIFESNDINIGWDGYLHGQLCEPGVYIWKVRGSFRNGEPFTKMGDLTLLKDSK